MPHPRRRFVRAAAIAASLAALLFAAVAPATSGSTEHVFAATADAFVDEGEPEANSGLADHLIADRQSAKGLRQHAYLQFRVTGVTGTVTSARVRLYAYDGTIDGPAIYASSDTWAEETINWTSAPAAVGTPSDDEGPIATESWVEYDVTRLVAGEGPVSFLLRPTNADAIRFYSREGARAPQLVVTTGPPESSSSPQPSESPVPSESTTPGGGSASPSATPSTDPGTHTPTPGVSPTLPTETATASPTSTPVPSSGDPVLVGAGDIASCESNGDEDTAKLLDAIAGTVFTTGDNAYPDGTVAEFNECYDPSWGRHKARTRPAPGNHDYHVPGAPGYFGYFGDAAGDPATGYYAYDLTAWRILVLNSECDEVPGGCDTGSPQEQWLRAELKAHSDRNVLAYWHSPRFSSGPHGSDAEMQAFWDALYEYGADVVLNGHDHTYERFAPQDPRGAVDRDHGIRQFVVGSGGSAHYEVGTPIANSEAVIDDTHGVLKLTLHVNGYSWEFVPEAGATATDSGTAATHGPPTPAPSTDVGYRDFVFDDVNNVDIPTADKPQSKLWFHDGSWWGLLYRPSASATRIHRLDPATQTWVDTGTTVDARPTARGDALWDDGKLYVVSATTVMSEWGGPPTDAAVNTGSADLSRFSYDADTRTYQLDPGFPVTVHQGSSESITLAKDSRGKLWVTYTKGSRVWINRSIGSDDAWGTPFVLPTTAAAVHYDDISAIVPFQGDKVGVMWSNQNNRKFYFAVHRDGDPDTAWQPTQIAYGGNAGGCSGGCANDHINLKQLTSDGSGRIFAAVKTANREPGQPFVALIVRDGNGRWTSHTFGVVEEEHTRPMVLLDEEHRQLYMFAVAPEIGGAIYYKKTNLDRISFTPGMGTTFIKSTRDTDISNPTSTKQNLNGRTGLVVLASANTNGYYWHNYLDLSGGPAPAPAAPTNLRVSAAATDPQAALKLTWSDNSANESGFRIERWTGAEAFAEVATVSAGSVSYVDSRLAAGKTYTYRVRAWNPAGESGYSNEASGTTGLAGAVRTFPPVADAYVDATAPDRNFGSATTVNVDASPAQESYLRFAPTEVTNATVTAATLRLYVINPSLKGGSITTVKDPAWAEGGVTYNGRPAVDGAVLTTLGPVNAGEWIEIDVTRALGTDGTLNVALKPNTADGAHYASREHPAHPPQLVLTLAVDATPPETTISTGASGPVRTTTASFAFTSDEAGATFECAVDGAPFAGCRSPQSYSNLSEGPHTFEVRATDATGNTDPTPASRAWTIDTEPPAAPIITSPADGSTVIGTSVTLRGTAEPSDRVRVFDGATHRASTTADASGAWSVVVTGLAAGAHPFTARAVDAAGNSSRTSETVTVSVALALP